MSRVLVTGGGGFIGSPVIAALRLRGYEVHGVSRRPHRAGNGVAWHRADLLGARSAAALVRDVRPTHLVHLAWYTTHGSFWTAIENVDWIAATLALLRAFSDAGGRRAVIAGSCAEYSWGQESLSEINTPLGPASLYGACKLATQIAADALATQREFELAWGRLFHLYGPGEDPGRLVAAVARRLLSGERAPTSAGCQIRDFLHVDDVAGGLVALLESDYVGAVNIASGAGVRVRDVVTQIGVATGRLDRVDFGAFELPRSEPRRLVGDVARLTREVGYRPSVPLSDGIARTVEWWRRRLSDE